MVRHDDDEEAEEEVDVVVDVVVVTVEIGTAVDVVIVVLTVVVTGSLHPNQPGGVLQEVVLIVLVIVVRIDVVVSSKQPHQPGVRHVAVRVLVEVLVEEDELLVVVLSVPLLSKNFQLKQSTHSVSSSQAGTVSYFSKTSLITLLILWVPMPTRQPRSPTVS